MESERCYRPFGCFSILECLLSDLLPFIFSCVKYSIKQLSFSLLTHSILGVEFLRPKLVNPMFTLNAWKLNLIWH